jgi:hypothetical protein
MHILFCLLHETLSLSLSLSLSASHTVHLSCCAFILDYQKEWQVLLCTHRGLGGRSEERVYTSIDNADKATHTTHANPNSHSVIFFAAVYV